MCEAAPIIFSTGSVH